jgi:uncharacterized repeat protein (TIGR01451 family)
MKKARWSGNAAAGITVTDPIPSGYTYVSDDGGGAYVAAGGTWTVGALAASASSALAIRVRVEPSGNYVNRAEVAASSAKDPDSTPGNGAAGEDDLAQRATTPGAVSDLSLTKTVDAAAPRVGADVVFTLTLHNAGPGAATGVVVGDLLPTGYA